MRFFHRFRTARFGNCCAAAGVGQAFATSAGAQQQEQPTHTPASWQCLQAYAADQAGELEAGRGPKRMADIEARYQRYFHWAKGRSHAGADYIKVTAQWRCEHCGPWVALEPNIVPYSLDEGIEHWNLWYHPNTKPGSADLLVAGEELCVSAVLRHVRLFLPDLAEDEVVIFQNLPHMRSIPSVAHVQVFIRPRSPQTRAVLCELRAAWRMRSPWAENERQGGRGDEVGW